jgi:D-xylose transport system ATP-binding protein
MRAPSSSPRLVVAGLKKSFGHIEALRHVDLEVLPGEVMALVGDNGAGKSTLIKALSGVHSPDEGEILVDGQRVVLSSAQDAVAAGIETVYQDLALCDNLDVVSNLFLGRELRSPNVPVLRRFLADRAMVSRARSTLKELGATLPDFSAQVATLSGGQRQAIAIGRAVLWSSSIVLLDEPTAALGVKQTAMVYELIRSLAARNISVVLISHNMQDVFEVADRITVMRLGESVGVFEPGRSTPDQVIAAMTGANRIVQGDTV